MIPAALRRVWLPWLLLLVPTLLIGATALWLLRNEQQRLEAARTDTLSRANQAARAQAQLAADNIELLVAEIRDGLIRELAETPETDLDPLLRNWPATNPLVAQTFLWRTDDAAILWPVADTVDRRAFRERHAGLFNRLESGLPAAIVRAPARKVDDTPGVAALNSPAPIIDIPRKDVETATVAQKRDEPPAAVPVQQAPAEPVAFSVPTREEAQTDNAYSGNTSVVLNQELRRNAYNTNRQSAAEAKRAPRTDTDLASNDKVSSKGKTASKTEAVVPAQTSSSYRSSAAPSSERARASAPAASVPLTPAFEPSAAKALPAEGKAGEAAATTVAELAKTAESATPAKSPQPVRFEVADAKDAARHQVDANTSTIGAVTLDEVIKEPIQTGALTPASAAPTEGSVPAATAQPSDTLATFASNQSGWIARRVNGRTYFLGWWQPWPGAPVRGVELNLPAVLERLQALVPAGTDGGRFALIGPAELAKGADVVVPLTSTLPGWTLAAWFAPIETDGSAGGKGFLVIAALLVAAFAASILAGGALFFRQAANAERDAALKTTFVSNVSHEMKTPLTTIRMYAEMLADERVTDPDKRRRYFATIGRETTRLTRLVNNALDFGRLEAGRKEYHVETIALAPWLARLVEVHAPRLAEAGLKLTLAAVPEGAAFHGDADSLEQITLNLLDNAAKYAAGGGEIELRAEPAKVGWSLVVADRGAGIPAAHRERIFERFHRVDDALTAKTQGAGLGLTIARRLARDQGGDLVYRDRPGGGAEFVLTLASTSDS